MLVLIGVLIWNWINITIDYFCRAVSTHPLKMFTSPMAIWQWTGSTGKHILVAYDEFGGTE